MEALLKKRFSPRSSQISDFAMRILRLTLLSTPFISCMSNAGKCADLNTAQLGDQPSSGIPETSFEVPSFDGVRLRGSMAIPSQLRALVIPIHGSFCQDRNGDLDSSSLWMYPEGTPKRLLFLDMSNALYQEGVGTFRYDKRASGKSEGVYEDTTLTVLAQDVTVILNEMRKQFPGLPIGIIGQSEGGLVALKAYDLGARPDFILLQSPALLPFDQILEYQKTRAAQPFLVDRSGTLEKKYPYAAAFFKAMYEGDMLNRIRSTDDQYYELKNGEWSVITSLTKYREYMWSGLDLLKKVKVPVAVFFGSKDLNVNPDVSKMIWDEQAHGSYLNVEVQLFEGLEHSFREVKEGKGFFESLSDPVSPRYLQALKDTVNRLTRR
ncbi:MAG: hypothetical protein C5B49_14660 [Bdellovibrio sp.]|nr:MAG: hypothetical protein C5B49_14660 [Bdellovibrio sp.]